MVHGLGFFGACGVECFRCPGVVEAHFEFARCLTVWFLVGNGGMDPYSSPYIIPNNSLHNPFPHSPLRTRQLRHRSPKSPIPLN